MFDTARQYGEAVTTTARRLAAQLLSGPPAASPEQVVERVLAVQAQDARGARLAIRSRSSGLTVADVDAALTDRRSLLISWLGRGTLHLVTPADYWLLHPLTTPQLATGSARRLEQEGVSPSQATRGIEVVEAAVASGPRTRQQLRDELDRAGVPTARQALVHVLLATALRGAVVRGPMVDGEHAFVDVRDWSGPAPPPLERTEALAQLARRYLSGHGPATARDLAKWAGLPLGEARRGFAAIAEELDGPSDALVDLAGREPPPPLPAPRLLGSFDPLLHGWESREALVGDHRGVVTSNGVFRPVALVGGRVVATWGLAGGALTIRPFDRVGRAVRSALLADAEAVLAFLDLPPGRTTMPA